jgi:cytochrome c
MTLQTIPNSQKMKFVSTKTSFSKLLWAVIPFGLLFGCDLTSKEVARPYEHWVFRSVLDLKPRMLSAVLGDGLIVAYDTEAGSLYKAWRGSINFDGPVYTSAHGPQPTSVGNTYMEEPAGVAWRIINNDGEQVTPTVKHKGHSFKGNKLTLTYELQYQDNVITVTESPEIVKTDDSLRVEFERKFTTNIPDNMSVALEVHLASLKTENDYKTTGKFIVSSREKEVVEDAEYYKVNGKLILNSNDETVFTATFSPKPMPVGDPEKLAGEESVLALMAKSDCNTCHNKERKTIGPSYIEIAERYPNYPEQTRLLIEKVISGGFGNWGDVAMTPHPDLSRNDAEAMVSYILDLDETKENEEANAKFLVPSFTLENKRYDFANASDQMSPGVAVNRYRFDEPVKDFPKLGREASFSSTSNAVYSDSRRGGRGNMLTKIIGNITLEKETNVVFRLVTEGKGRLYLDNKLVVNNARSSDPIKMMDGEMLLSKGLHKLRMEFIPQAGGRYSLQWKPHHADSFEIVPPLVFSYSKADIHAQPPAEKVETASVPGDGSPLQGVHPSFDLAQARPNGFEPKVGGMDFLSDGRMVVSTWDSLGSVYLLEGVEGNDPKAIAVKKIAYGLTEPLGVKVVDDTIYVLQKQELTRLVDNNNDDIIDEYQTVCNGWKVSANFHEFAFGLLYRDGYFYGTLATAINPGGASTRPQIPDRGKVIRIARDGSYEFLASGLRTPNGIGFGVDNEIFIADNQGDWLPASKIVHLQEDAWYGSRSVDFEGTEGKEETLPVVWLQQDEIGNSPSQPAVLNVGPYQNQMIHGEVTHGGIKRVFAEKVSGRYQGAVFRFTQGLEAGINRLAWGPDGSLYAGGVGSTGNWGHSGKLRYGLQRLTFNNTQTFEMLAIRAKPNGIEIEFTEPLKEGVGLLTSDYSINQWYYKPTPQYGGPKMEERPLPIDRITISDDRKKVLLQLGGMKARHLIYVRLNRETMISASAQELWSTEGWYTMNAIPGLDQNMVATVRQ